MELKEITNKEKWEEFLNECTEKTFLQSWNWGEFNVKNGSKIWRFGVYEPASAQGYGEASEKLISVCLVIKTVAKRGTFFYIPHGPVMQSGLETTDKKQILQVILLELAELSKGEGASFIRISPIIPRAEESEDIFWELRFRNAPMPASAYEATWKLDLLPKNEDLVHSMRKTTRYLIRKAQENPDVSIEITADPKNIEIYQKLNKAVGKRQNFIPFSDNFIKNEFEVFEKDNQVVFVFGKYKNEVVAGAMIIFWSGVAFYHQAASIGKYAKLSIPYLLQWEAIKEAEAKGCAVYDFWGFTDPEKFPHHPWAGPTLFKMGFGGRKEEYVATQDFVLSSKYWINYIIEKLRRLRRGL